MKPLSCRSRPAALLLAGLGAALIGAMPAAAQYPRARPGQFEVRGLDFRRDGAWRLRTAAVRARRHALLRSGRVAALNVPAFRAATPSPVAVTGRYVVPVVPVTFPVAASGNQEPEPFRPADYQSQLFHGDHTRAYSLKTYYEELSGGRIRLDGQVFPWVHAPRPDTYYEDGCNGVGITSPCPHGGGSGADRFGELLLYALDIVSTGPDSATVWAAFDNDGPDGIPNSGDDDGVVDFVTFLQPELDGACGSNPNIWAHRYVLRAFKAGSPYVTRTPWAGHPGQYLKVDDYTMQSGQGGPGACTAGQIMPIGTVAHETGHAFGLPDLYDTDVSNPASTAGIGEWGLMGSGNYARPYSPARMEAWSLVELGWAAVDTLGAARTVTLSPVAVSDTVLLIPAPGTDEYFLLENRQALGSDTAMFNPQWDAQAGRPRAKQPGLLVWHIDQGQVDLHGFSGDNRVNSGPIHGVALLQADGLGNLDAAGTSGRANRGDRGDAYPGSMLNRTLGAASVPALRDNQGGFPGFTIDSIYELAPGTPGPVAFRFTPGIAGPPPVTVALAAAVDAILGRTPLPADQAALLDQQGNRNGVYDLGDFLAYLDATGQAAGAGVMARLQARRRDAPAPNTSTQVRR